jgi:hypothetical protein
LVASIGSIRSISTRAAPAPTAQMSSSTFSRSLRKLPVDRDAEQVDPQRAQRRLRRPADRDLLEPEHPERPRAHRAPPAARTSARLRRPGSRRVDQDRHVAAGVLVLAHQLVARAGLGEREGARQARVDLAVDHQLVDAGGLRVVGEVRALQALLPHPVVAQIERRVVAGGAGADHDHAAGLGHEARGRQRGLAGVLEHDRRALLLAERVPERLAEIARALEPQPVLELVAPARQLAPVAELAAIDDADRAELLAVLDLVVARHHRDRAAAGGLDDLDRHRAEAAGAAPHQHRIAGVDDVGRPAVQHPVGGRADQHVRRGLLPGQVRRLGQALVVLHLGVLREAAPVGLVAPDDLRRREHRVLAGDPRIVAVPHAAVDDDLVADLDVLTADPTAHTTPDASEPPMWKSSGSPFFCRVLITSIGTPIAAQTLL